MVLIQNHSLSLRCPFKHNTKPAVSVPDLLTPNPVLCASARSFTVSLPVCPLVRPLCHSVSISRRNQCCYEEQLVQSHTNRPVEIGTKCGCQSDDLVIWYMELGSVMNSFFILYTLMSSILSLSVEKLCHQGM